MPRYEGLANPRCWTAGGYPRHCSQTARRFLPAGRFDAGGGDRLTVILSDLGGSTGENDEPPTAAWDIGMSIAGPKAIQRLALCRGRAGRRPGQHRYLRAPDDTASTWPRAPNQTDQLRPGIAADWRYVQRAPDLCRRAGWFNEKATVPSVSASGPMIPPSATHCLNTSNNQYHTDNKRQRPLSRASGSSTSTGVPPGPALYRRNPQTGAQPVQRHFPLLTSMAAR